MSDDHSANDEAADTAYEPSTVEINRGRQQGLGMGSKDIAGQRDPTSADSTQHHGVSPDGDAVEPTGGDTGLSGLDSQAGPPGQADADYDDRAADQVDVDRPAR